MGKHGPCRHCGVTSTPLWRNGPPDKPVLCNACGSRWRTKGSLTNYTPLHAREPNDSEEFKVSKFKSISFKPKEKKLQKIKQSCVAAAEKDREIPYSDQNFRKILEVDTSNRSSSGSATSYSESCAHFGTTEASDITGSAQSHVWESQVPSKKRTGFIRANPKPSPIEELTKDLYTIMQEQEFSYFSSSEDLIYESETPMGSFEISTGSVLLRYPNPKVEEESEASSFPIDNKSCIINEAYSGSASKGRSLSAVGTEKLKKSTEQVAQGHVKRDKSYTDKSNLLRDRDSPLSITDLKDVVNFEVLMKHMTGEEQQRLMKYLPSIDTDEYPESLRTMFKSSQFVETLPYFQQLLKEGIFDLSISGTYAEETRTLKRLVLQNLSRSTWVDHYKKLKDIKNKRSTEETELGTGSNYLGRSNFTSLKRARETQNLHALEVKGTMRSPKRATLHPSSADTGSRSIIDDTEDFVDNDGTCFSPRTIFADNNNFDHDMLLDVPCNNFAFPDAQHPYPLWGQKRNNTSVERRLVADEEESLSNFPASSFSSQKARNR